MPYEPFLSHPKSDKVTNSEHEATANAKRVTLVDSNGNVNDVQYPMSTNGDSVYAKDIWVDECVTTDWTDVDGAGIDVALIPFTNLHARISNNTSDNPKILLIHFNRTVVSNAIGFGCTGGGNFSNVKIEIVNSGGVYTTVIDESSNSAKDTSRTFPLPVTAGFNAIRITFATADAVCLSNLFILKTQGVVARLQGTKEDGTVGDVVMSNSNRVRTVSQPYTYAIAESDIPNHFGLLKFGTRTTVAAGTSSTIWEGNTARYVYMATAQQLKVVSSSTDDTSAGTGARTLRLIGLDSDYNEIIEDITLNGTTQVTTTNSFIRIYRSFVLTCGTAYTNVGKITIYNNAATVEQAVINAGDGQTLMTMWTVPAGKTAYIVRGGISTNSNKGARISLFVRKLDGGILYPWLIKYRGFIFSGAVTIPIEIPFEVPEKSDIEMTVLTPVSAGDTSVGATFELWYE